MTFQKTVLYIAVILLILSLSIIGFMLYKSKNSVKYPPELSVCPDFWEIKPVPGQRPMPGVTPQMICQKQYLDGNQDTAINSGTFQAPFMDFNAGQFKGPQGLRAKCKWALGKEIYWSGITDSPSGAKCNIK